MELVIEAWETSQNIASFRMRENDLHEHFQVDLKNEEPFLYTDSDLFWKPCHQHLRSENKTRVSPLPKPNQTNKIMLERES